MWRPRPRQTRKALAASAEVPDLGAEVLRQQVRREAPEIVLTRQGYLIEDQGMTYLADLDAGNALASWQTDSYTYRIALAPIADRVDDCRYPANSSGHPLSNRPGHPKRETVRDTHFPKQSGK